MTTPDFNIRRHLEGNWEECTQHIDENYYEDIFHTLLSQGDYIMAIGIERRNYFTVVFQQAHVMNEATPKKSIQDYWLELCFIGAILSIMAIYTEPVNIAILAQISLMIVWFYVSTYNDGLASYRPIYKLDPTKAKSLPIQDINDMNHTLSQGDRIMYFKGRHGEIRCDMIKTINGWEQRFYGNTDIIC